MPRRYLAASVCAGALLAACASADLPPGFGAEAAQSPEDQATRLWLAGDTIVAAAVALGPGGLPPAVRTAADAIAPGGEVVFAGSEWGPRGAGFRIDKRWREGIDESWSSLLLDRDGSVLERTHSVPIAKVPAPVLVAAMQVGRDLQRCEIVSGRAREEGWRVLVRDGGGRTFVVELSLDGTRHQLHRCLNASLFVR